MNKQDEEILILELFKKNYAEFPKGLLVKSESPDFILKINPKKSIGIEITRLHDGNISKNNPGFPVADLNIENLKSTITKKEEMIQFYRKKKLQELWLIIAADYFHLSSGENLSELIADLEIYSRYQKIFLMDLFYNKVFSLSLK